VSPLTVERLEASLLRERVSERVRQAIRDLELVPGERLIERDLAERTGASRATIREAIRELASEGLVTVVPQRGAIVCEPTPKEAAEIYELRSVIEGLAGRHFALSASDDDVEDLRQAYKDFVNAQKATNDIRAWLRCKAAFYEVLFRGADNPTIQTAISSLQTRVAVLRTASMSMPGRARLSAREIKAIVDAAERRDPDAAALACQRHVEAAGEAALKALRLGTSQTNKEPK
jgi:DNA-binding GntR family transcriptional regulator